VTPGYHANRHEWRAALDAVSFRRAPTAMPPAPERCEHDMPSTDCIRITSNGRRMRVLQCSGCGDSLKTMKLHAENVDPNQLPAYRPELCARNRARWDLWQQQRGAALERAEAQSDQRNSEWWSVYNAYLRSEAWSAKRSHVIKRSKGRCEGCAIVPGQHVHHLSYKSAGDEFLFELVHVCEPCHERWHLVNDGED